MDATAPTPASLKESGNAHFREGRVSEAIAEYSKALVLLQSSPSADASKGTDTDFHAMMQLQAFAFHFVQSIPGWKLTLDR